jgi:hypothetical protein
MATSVPVALIVEATSRDSLLPTVIEIAAVCSEFVLICGRFALFDPHAQIADAKPAQTNILMRVLNIIVV